MLRPFHPFTAEHFTALGLGIVALLLFMGLGKRGGKCQRVATALLVFLNLSAYPISMAAWMTVKMPHAIDHFIPLHMCDIAAVTGGLALITRRPWLCSVTYFWGLAATLQALVTPAISVGFPELPMVMFFVQHFAVVIAALYLPIVLGWRPKCPWWRSPLEMCGISLIYLLVAMTANHWLGSNFAFVSHPPENPSLIDHLGPWPGYIFWLLGIAFALYFLLVLPFYRHCSSARKASPAPLA